MRGSKSGRKSVNGTRETTEKVRRSDVFDGQVEELNLVLKRHSNMMGTATSRKSLTRIVIKNNKHMATKNSLQFSVRSTRT